MEISERLNIDYGKALTYHQLGMIAGEQRDFHQAEKWYRKSLEISERIKDESLAAKTYLSMSIISKEKGNIIESGSWSLKSIITCIKINDDVGMQVCVPFFKEIYGSASSKEKKQLKNMWEDAGLGEFPEG